METDIIDPREMIQTEITVTENTCCICYTHMEETEQYVIPECRHKFHVNCLITWFRTGGNTCPCCRGIPENDSTINSYCMFSRYKFNRRFAQRKEAPKSLVKLVLKLRNMEKKRAEKTKEFSEWRRSDEYKIYKELAKKRDKFRLETSRNYKNYRKIRYDIANFPVIPVPVPLKKS